MSPLQSATLFLLNFAFDFYTFLLILRFVLQYLRVDYYNPLSQFVVKFTNPVIIPLRRRIPGFWGLDIATLVVFILLNIIKNILIALITFKKFPSIFGLLIWSTGDMATSIVKLFFYAVILQIILSWMAPRGNTASLSQILYRLTEPFLRPIRRIVPPIAGFDISPIPLLILLQLIIILFTNPITQVGFQFALR